MAGPGRGAPLTCTAPRSRRDQPGRRPAIPDRIILPNVPRVQGWPGPNAGLGHGGGPLEASGSWTDPRASAASVAAHNAEARLDKGTFIRTLQRMKTIGVTELRQRTAEILREVHDSDEPVAIIQRSEKAAYLVDADRYDAEREELRVARRSLFMREVREAEAEYGAGEATTYDDVEALLDDLRA